MAQQGSKQPAPTALAVQHLARAAAAASSPALGAVLGRRMLQVAASAGHGLPRGTARPCPHCGAFNAEGDSQVLKLPRRVVRQELQQQAAAQARGRGSGQPVSRWVAVSTCTVCGQEIRRRLQHPPSLQQQQQQQLQPAAAGKAATPSQQPSMAQQQPSTAQQQQQQPAQQQPAEEELRQEATLQPAAQQPGRPEQESSQDGEGVQVALLAGGVQQASQPVAARQLAEQAAASTRPEAGGSVLEPAAEQQAAEQPADDGAAGQPATMAWALVQEAWGLQPSRLEGRQEAQLPAALLPAAPAANAEEDSEAGSGDDNAATPGDAADAGPPRKRRRLSWSDNLQQVKLIDRAPRPQLRKVYSWHRLARSWKAASFKVG